MSIPSELDHSAMPIIFLVPKGKTRRHERDSNRGPLDPANRTLCRRATLARRSATYDRSEDTIHPLPVMVGYDTGQQETDFRLLFILFAWYEYYVYRGDALRAFEQYSTRSPAAHR